MAIAGILLLGTLVIFYEAPPLYKQERYKDLVVFLILTVLGLTLSILLLLDVPIGSPTVLIKKTSDFLWGTFKRIACFFSR